MQYSEPGSDPALVTVHWIQPGGQSWLSWRVRAPLQLRWSQSFMTNTNNFSNYNFGMLWVGGDAGDNRDGSFKETSLAEQLALRWRKTTT